MKNTRRISAVVLLLAFMLANCGVPAFAEAVLKLPKAMKIISEEAFCGDTSLDEVVLPDGTTQIGARAFADSSITTINLPDSLTSIADDAFENSSLETVTANRGTYAYKWGVEHGYIDDSLKLSVECDADAVVKGYAATWTASADNGVEPYTYRFVLRQGSTTLDTRDYGAATYTHTFPSTGEYALDVTAKDAESRVSDVCTLSITVEEPKIILTKKLLKTSIYENYKDNLNLLDTDLDLVHSQPAQLAENLTFESSDTSIATVAADGAVTPWKTGVATLTIRSAVDPTIYASIPLYVETMLTYPTLTPASADSGYGLSGSFRVEYGKYYARCRLIYDDELLEVTMDDESEIHADTITYHVKKAVTEKTTATIQLMTSYDFLIKATFTLTIYPAPQAGDISFAKDTVKLKVGDSYTNVATCASGTMGKLLYESSDPEYVSVDENGCIKALKNTEDGVYIAITAYSAQDPEVKATCKVYVCSGAPTGIAFNKTLLKTSIYEDYRDYLNLLDDDLDLIRLTPVNSLTDYTFTSSDTSVATVAADGTVTPRKTGTTTLTIACTDAPGVQASIPLYVETMLTYPTLNPASAATGYDMSGSFRVEYGQYYARCRLVYDKTLLDVELDDESEIHSDTITYYVKKNVTEKTTATIKLLTSYDDLVKATFTVTIYPAPKQGELTIDSEKELALGVGDTNYSVHASYAEGTMCNIVYTSDKPEYVQVDAETGKITPVKQTPTGEKVTITASSTGSDAYDTCTVTVYPAPESIDAAKTFAKLGTGETVNILSDKVMTVSPSDAHATFTYESSNPSCATVDASGTVTAVAQGSAKITLTAHNNKSCTVTVYVYASGAKPTLTPASATMGAQMSGSFRAVFGEEGYTLYTAEYDNELISSVSIDTTSELYADTITYTVGDVKTATDTQILLKNADDETIATFALTILPAPKAGEVSFPEEQRNIELGVGNNVYTLTPQCAEGTMSEFTFASDNTKYVTVDAETGVLKAVAVTPDGTTVHITATSKTNSKAYAVCNVRVYAAPESVIRTKAYVKIGTDETLDTLAEGLFKVSPEDARPNLIFTSTDPDVATVDANGVITTLTKGKTVVTASAYNDLSASVTVYVYDYAVPALKPGGVTIGESSTSSFDVSFAHDTYARYDVTCTSSLVTIDRVNTTSKAFTDTVSFSVGSVEAEQNATIQLVGKKGDILASFEVTVLPAPDAITCAPESIEMGVGQAGYCVEGACPEGMMCTFVYTSDNEEVAKISANGVITAVGEGTANITVSANNSSATATCAVTVCPQPTKISLSQSILKMGEGDTAALSGTKGMLKLTPENCKTTLTYTSSDESVATVDEDGTITAKKAGGTSILITTHNGQSCTLSVYVYDKADALKTIDPENLVLGGNMEGSIKLFYPEDTYAMFTASAASPVTIVGCDCSGTDGDTVTVRTAAVTQKTDVVISFIGQDKTVKGTSTVTVLPGPESVTIKNVSIGLGDKGVKPEISYPTADTMCAFEYTSDHPEIATVNSKTNEISALSLGTATITARSLNSAAQTTFTVTVLQVPAIIDYEDLEQIGIAKGDTVDLPQPHVFDANNNEMQTKLTFTSSDVNIAKIVDDSRVEGVASGEVTITATTYNGVSVNLQLIVSEDTITDVSFDTSEVTLYIDGAGYGDTHTLTAKVVGKDITHGTVTYSLKDEASEVISVTPQGTVQALAIGDAEVVATAFNDVTSSENCTVHVEKLTTTLVLNVSEIDLGEGMTYVLLPTFDEGTGAKVLYATDDPDIALVSADGVITAVTAGDTRVTARIMKGEEIFLEKTVDVSVIAGPSGIDMVADELSLAVEDSVEITKLYTLRSKVTPYWDEVTVSGYDETIVKIEGDCIVALAEGSTKLIFSTCNGYMDEMSVNVAPKGEETKNGFAWTGETTDMICGLTAPASVCIDAEGAKRGYTLKVKNPEDKTVLRIDGSNVLTAVEAGTATLQLILNASEASELNEEQVAEVQITVYTYTDVQMQMSTKVEIAPNEMQDYTFGITFPKNLICSVPITYALSNGYVQFIPNVPLLAPENNFTGAGIIAAGTLNNVSTELTFFENPELVCTITIPLPRYRALIISEYNNSSASNNLPFTANNVSSLKMAFANANIDGETYDTMVLQNPNKASIATAINTHFINANSQDVSVIYIVSHGYYSATTDYAKCYHFGLTSGSSTYSKSDSSTYVTANQLLSYMKNINGNVILLLDTCSSGGFISDTSGELAQLGNISVMTAQVNGIEASYFAGSTEATRIEFFTYAICYGLGVEIPSTYKSVLAADSEPTDGKITIGELFPYTVTKTIDVIAEKRAAYPNSVVIGGGSTPYSGWYQTPQTFIGTDMSDVVILARDTAA